jgi:hypothetical protein
MRQAAVVEFCGILWLMKVTIERGDFNAEYKCIDLYLP